MTLSCVLLPSRWIVDIYNLDIVTGSCQVSSVGLERYLVILPPISRVYCSVLAGSHCLSHHHTVLPVTCHTVSHVVTITVRCTHRSSRDLTLTHMSISMPETDEIIEFISHKLWSYGWVSLVPGDCDGRCIVNCAIVRVQWPHNKHLKHNL